MRRPLLQVVGYWPGIDPFLAHPRRLVRRGWRTADRPRIVRYLRGGTTLFRGYACSYCRFGCFPPDEDGGCPEMGGRDLTDGVWMWPEGLAHYVEPPLCPSARRVRGDDGGQRLGAATGTGTAACNPCGLCGGGRPDYGYLVLAVVGAAPLRTGVLVVARGRSARRASVQRTKALGPNAGAVRRG